MGVGGWGRGSSRDTEGVNVVIDFFLGNSAQGCRRQKRVFSMGGRKIPYVFPVFTLQIR